MPLTDVDIEEIIQIIESRRDLTPAQYTESRKQWLDKILNDKDLEKELVLKFVNYRKSESGIMEFVMSVHKHDF